MYTVVCAYVAMCHVLCKSSITHRAKSTTDGQMHKEKCFDTCISTMSNTFHTLLLTIRYRNLPISAPPYIAVNYQRKMCSNSHITKQCFYKHLCSC